MLCVYDEMARFAREPGGTEDIPWETLPRVRDTAVPGIVYLIHFERKLSGGAQHYFGWTADLERRIRRHRTPHSGSRLLIAVNAARIPWQVARTWDGTRADERRRKDARSAPSFCPLCKGKAPRYDHTYGPATDPAAAWLRKTHERSD